MSIDNSERKKKKKTVLSVIDTLDNLDDIVTISHKNQNKKPKLETTKKISDYFKVDKNMAKTDMAEFRRQIALQKEEFMKNLKKKGVGKKRVVKKPTDNMFGVDINTTDPDELKKQIRKRKEEFIKNIRKDKSIPDKKIKKKEIIKDGRITKRTVDPFDSSLHDLDIVALKLELENKKKEFRKQLESGIVRELAQDLSYLEMVIEVLADTHFDLSFYKPSFIYRRVKRRLMKLKLTTLESYMNHIMKNSAEIDILKKELSINVTKFKRDRPTWDHLLTNVLPKIIKDKNGNIKIWSAAAAIGAEAYSIAMLMDQLSSYKFSIIASDINPKLLELARQGDFHENYVKELTEAEISKYFSKRTTIHGNEYTVNPTLKKNISFYKLDLFIDDYPKNIDIIFARNIWIYFDKPEKVFNKMYEVLNKNGLIILGGTETIPHQLRDKFKVLFPRYQIYQKV